MTRSIALLRWPFSSLLLLGILVLLLWGECSQNNESPACCGTRVVRVDSLAALLPGAPPKLYLTLGLRNEDPDAAKLESVRGALLFQGRYWSSFYRAQRRRIVVPAKKELLIPMVLALTDSLACDPSLLHQLQSALHKGTAGDSSLLLNLSVNVFLKKEEGYLEDSGTGFPLPALHSSARLPRQ